MNLKQSRMLRVILTSIGISCVIVIGCRWVFQWRTGVNPGVVPTTLTPFKPTERNTRDWYTHSTAGVKFSLPPDWMELPAPLKAGDAFYASNQHTLLVIHDRELWSVSRYRSIVYTRWNPLRLLRKAAITELLDPKNPRIIEQRIGPWTAFIFPSPRRWRFDLFNDSRTVLVIFSLKYGAEQLDEQLMREIVATIQL